MQAVTIGPSVAPVPKIAFIHKIVGGKEIINATLTFYVTKELVYLELERLISLLS